MLSLILPTYNEAENLPVLIPAIAQELDGLEYEIIIVDDNSPDKTWQVARRLAREFPAVSCIRRMHRHGLASAVIEGWLAASGDVLAVMDADGQHDMSLLRQLYDAVQSNADLAVGSRYVEGGSVGEWDERRYRLSQLATRMAMGLSKVKVADPMSGFFALKRSLFETVLPLLNPKGFKILLDVLVHAPAGTTATEVPFSFSNRLHGDSKLSPRVQLDFIEYLYDVTIGRYVPLTFLKYCLVGLLGVIVNLIVYQTVTAWYDASIEISFGRFSLALILAIETAIVINFLLNNSWTFARHRLTGWRAVRGFVLFNVVCLVGAFANYSVSAYLFSLGSGELFSVVCGAVLGAVWNYTMAILLTWQERN